MMEIELNKFADMMVRNDPEQFQKNELVAALQETLAAKKAGAKCCICGAPIWVAGSGASGSYRCFTCTTGETDSSEDYEII